MQRFTDSLGCVERYENIFLIASNILIFFRYFERDLRNTPKENIPFATIYIDRIQKKSEEVIGIS